MRSPLALLGFGCVQETSPLLGAQRMRLGHTIQYSPTSACEDRVWRMDLGRAEHDGGPAAALKTRGEQLTLLGPWR